MISRRSLFGFALVPLATKDGQIAYAEAYGRALAERTSAQMAPRLAALARLRDATDAPGTMRLAAIKMLEVISG